MKLRSNAHTHTIHCDGKNTAQEMVEAAIKLGFTGLGFSGHSPAPFDPTCLGIKDEVAYRKDIAVQKEKYADKIEVLCGIEQDFDAPVNRNDYDYILGSVHYVEDGTGGLVAVDGTPEHLLEVKNGLFGGDGIAMAREFYRRSVENVRQYRPEIVGHFDLIVKHNQNGRLFDEQSKAYKDIALQAMDEVAGLVLEYGGIVELNTGGMARGYLTTPYPSINLLKHLAQRNVRIMINSDSHNAKTLDYQFEKMIELVKEIGFTKLAVIANGAFEDIEI